MTVARCLSEREAATVLGVSVFTLRKWRWQGKGPRYVKFAGADRGATGVAGRIAYQESALTDFIQRSTIATSDHELDQANAGRR